MSHEAAAVPADHRDGRATPRVQDGALPAQPGDMPAVGWATILRRSVHQFKYHDILDRAAALTYYGILAIFPFVLLLVSVLGLLGASTTDKVLTNIEAMVPSAFADFLTSVIAHVQGSTAVAGVVGIISIVVALWSASRYVSGFIHAANAIYDVDEGRPIWKTVPLRLAVTLALVVMLAVSAILVVVTGPIAAGLGGAFGVAGSAVLAWEIAKWPVLLVVIVVMFSLLYRACPNVKQPGLRWIGLGSVIAVISWLVASGLFAVYLSFSGSYNSVYGPLSSVIVFLVWLWITNVTILLGAEINAEIQRERAIRAGMPEDLDQFAELRDMRALDEKRTRAAEEAAFTREITMTDEP